MELPIATGWYEDAVKPIAAQECTNWQPQVPQTNGYNQAQLVRTPGIESFATAGTKAARGEHEMAGIAYSVNGNNLYRVNSDGTTTELGAITGSGKVSIADNGVQMCIVVPGGNAYIYTVAGGLVQITNTNFTTTLGPSQQVIFKDSYFIHFNNNSAASTRPIFFKSAANDGTTYSATDFSDAETDPDEITGIHNNRNQLYIGGRQTIEPFQNIGGADFPYQRVSGGVIQKGVKAKFSIKDFDNSFVFVGAGENESVAVWRANGAGDPVRISTDAIDNVLKGYTDAEQSEIYATTYSENGEYFYTLHLPNRTFSYLAAASVYFGRNIWIERKSKDSNGLLTNWRVSGIVQTYGVTLVTDDQSGRIGKMSRSIFTEYGTSVNRAVTTQPLNSNEKPISFDDIELVCLTGSANSSGAGSDPYVTRTFSDDGGYTFSNGASRSLGKQGNRKIRQVWKREGQAPTNRIYRFVIDEPIDAAIIKLEAA